MSQNGQEQLKRLESLIKLGSKDAIKSTDFVTPDELSNWFAGVVEVIKTLKDNNDQTVREIVTHVSKIEKLATSETVLTKKQQESLKGELESLKGELSKKLEELRSEIPKEKSIDLSILNSKETPLSIKKKLESLKGEHAFDITKAKGADKFMTKETLERAVSILDNRTSYLLNKIKTLEGLIVIGTGLTPATGQYKIFVTVGSSNADFLTGNYATHDACINAAITYVNGLGGGIVWIKSGTYNIANRIIPLSHVWLRGETMFSTVLKATSTLNRGIIDNKTEYDTNNPYLEGIISDLELDGTDMNQTAELKGINSDSLNNCKIMRVYAHDTTATGIGADDFYGTTITECIVINCGYMNKRVITSAVWAAGSVVFTTSTAHGYSINDGVIVTGMVPVPYNGRFTVTAVTTNTFTITSSPFLTIDPGTATTFGISSDSKIGHNGIGIASGSNTHEANIITNNICIGNQNNNYLIEADDTGTDANMSYIFANNYSAYAGQAGYRNTGTPNTQFLNNFDYGSLIGFVVGSTTQVRAVSNATWSGGVATFTLATTFSTTISTGDFFDITGMTPSGYNGYHQITVINQSSFTVPIAADPGTATVFGNVTRVPHPTDDTLIENNISSHNIWYGLRLVSRSGMYNIVGNTFKNSYYYGVSTFSSDGNITSNFIYNNGAQGIDIATGSGTFVPIQNVIINSNHIFNNGTRVTADGIDIEAHISGNAPINNITITDNHIYDEQEVPTQRYGVILRSGGSLTKVKVQDNNFNRNTTAGVLKQNTDLSIIVKNNIGFNPDGPYAVGNVSTTATFDRVNGIFQTATLTGNTTFAVTASTIVGELLTLELSQDSTGGWTITWPVNVKLSGGQFILSKAASSIDIISFVWDGSNWRERYRAQAYRNTLKIISTSVNYTVTDADDIIKVAVSGKIITLHDATTAVTKRYSIQNASNGNISFATTSSQTVNGSTTGTIIPNQSLEVVPDGSNWIIT